MPTPPAPLTPDRALTVADIRQIISQRSSGQDPANIAIGMNLDAALVTRVLAGVTYGQISAPIFAKMVFPSQG
jgi:hypothetical protein